jgi:hypothetical protein
MNDEFIELHRHFASIPAALKLRDGDDAEPIIGAAAMVRWADLLALQRVVILAGPGAGKTWEIRHAAERLRAEGKAAFFLRLEHVAADLTLAFDVGTHAAFIEWLGGHENGWIFLDSVDEARLADPRDFDLALRRFGEAIAGHGQRAHIYITSRLHEWRWESDARLVAEKLPFKPLSRAQERTDGAADEAIGGSVRGERTKSTSTLPPSLQLVALASLSREQMLEFARKREAVDAERLIDEIERKDATQFASRPQDLQDLIVYWHEHKRIGRRAELIKASIPKKLRERDPNRAVRHALTEEKAREGARLLAAATTFQRTSRIVLSGSDSSQIGVIATEVLPGWSHAEVSTLLSRPLFDEPIYGTVRFHHRSIREFLAAEWLLLLLQDGKSRRAIEGLLLREQYGVEVVALLARPMLAWLSLWDDALRAIAMRLAPEILIEEGDPSELPIEIRKALLRAFCREYEDRTRGHHAYDAAAIQRFAHEDLADTIAELLEAYRANVEIAPLLLALIWHGRLRACFGIACTVACDRALDPYTRVAAIRATVATAPAGTIESVRDAILAAVGEADEGLVAAVLREVDPAQMPVDVIFRAIEKLSRPRRFSHRSVDSALHEYVDAMPLARIKGLLEAIVRKLAEPPYVENRYFKASRELVWLLPLGTRAVERLAAAQHPDALSAPALSVVSLTSRGEHYHHYGRREHRLRELVSAWPDLNHALFWHDVADERAAIDATSGERLTEFWRVNVFRDLSTFTADDFDRVVGEITAKEFLDDRLVALSLALAIRAANKKPRRWLERLKRAVRGEQELRDALQKLLHPPPPSADMQRHKRSERVFAQRRKKREAEQDEREGTWKSWLREHTSVLRDASNAPKGSVWKATLYLLEAQRERDGSRSRWSDGNWEGLAPEFGEPVARAFRDGTVAYWRGFTPPLRSEGVANPNSVPNAIMVGLTGLEIEARETQDWPCTLTREEVQLACRYALWELNGFPEWMPALYAEHRDAVRNILLGEMRWELATSPSGKDAGYVISNLRPYGSWIKDDVAYELLRTISVKAPANERLGKEIVSLALGCDAINGAAIAAMAKQQAGRPMGLGLKAQWLAAWTSVEASDGIDAVEAELRALMDASAARELAMMFAVALLGNQREGAGHSRQAYRAARHLLRLHRVLHRYIKPSEDLQRHLEEGCYSPSLRDDAQEARDRVLGYLREIPGKETYLALRAIAESCRDEPARRRWIEHQAKSKAVSDADASMVPWTTEDVLSFASERERKPRTHRQLYDFIVARLGDLKRELENGDSSIADLVIRSPIETGHRKYIGNWLRDKSLARYVVPQEEELADAKRPDIRIHSTGFDGPVPIELKIADKWSGSELFERLENQLCGDYLRDGRSSCGIYMLVNRGKERKRWQHPVTGVQMRFAELVDALQSHAASHIANDPKLEAITVVGIDLTARARARITRDSVETNANDADAIAR